MIFSNHLSRNVMMNEKSKEPTCQGLDMKIHDVYLSASEGKCVSCAAETSKDEVLSALKIRSLKAGHL